jgi:hypothetical protein
MVYELIYLKKILLLLSRQFISKFEAKLNQLELAKIAGVIVRSFNDTEVLCTARLLYLFILEISAIATKLTPSSRRMREFRPLSSLSNRSKKSQLGWALQPRSSSKSCASPFSSTLRLAL